jgi:UDP-N-acetylmuramyl pentapeptide phosphotransferase/UDP-N-acetylglucosamine-1-phosphate transferase
MNAAIVLMLAMRGPFMFWFKRSKKADWAKTSLKLMRRWHPIIGGVLVISGITHGYLAWGWNFRHTGYLLYVAIILQWIFGIGLLCKKKKLKVVHRFVSIGVLVFLGLHIFYRTALG